MARIFLGVPSTSLADQHINIPDALNKRWCCLKGLSKCINDSDT